MARQYLIVGGNSGVGLALVKFLEDKGDQATTISRSGNYPCDIEAESPSFPPIDQLDGLVYLPGTITLKPFPKLTVSDFKHDFEINVLGAVKTIQNYLPTLSQSNFGSIILMSSVAVGRGFPYHTSISSAKGAIVGLMRALAAELSPKIRVNAVAPSLTETPLSAPLIDTDQKKDASAKKHPLGRIGKPEDIAAMIAYLLSEQASWITGQVFGVDGGISKL